MVNSKHLSNKSESTSTVALKTRKAPTIGNDCIPSTSRTNNEASFVEVIKNLIKKSSRETISNIIRKVVREELQNHEKKNIATNEGLDKISVD